MGLPKAPGRNCYTSIPAGDHTAEGKLQTLSAQEELNKCLQQLHLSYNLKSAHSLLSGLFSHWRSNEEHDFTPFFVCIILKTANKSSVHSQFVIIKANFNHVPMGLLITEREKRNTKN